MRANRIDDVPNGHLEMLDSDTRYIMLLIEQRHDGQLAVDRLSSLPRIESEDLSYVYDE